MTTRFLVAYCANSTHVQTTLDYLRAIRHSTNYDVEYVHVTHDAIMDFDFSPYDVVFHNYCARLCFEGYVSESYRAAMRAFRGLKVLAVQDEYDETNRLRQAILDLGFHIVLTCVPQESLDYVYPRKEFAQIEFVTVFTGYAPDDSADPRAPVRPLKDRRIVVGYRGRDIGGRYGQLAFDKYEIGRRMKEICGERSLTTDIAMDEESRIYGLAWLNFVGDCRAMLGTESGSNVFDFDRSIVKSYEELKEALGRPPSYQEFTSAEPVVAVRDREIAMGQISPRVFECAVMRTPMVLFEGKYSGAIAAHEHYIPLRKDFSNADEVLDKLRDIDALEAMTGRAYNHLIASHAFNYTAFWQKIGAVIAKRLENLPPRDRATDMAQKRTPSPAEKAYLSEKPTREPLGLEHIEALTARGDLDFWFAELQRVDRFYRDAIDRSLQFASQLCDVLRENSPPGGEAPAIKTFEERVTQLKEDARRILAKQSASAEKAEALRRDWQAATPGEVALPKLQALIAFHSQWAAEYANEYAHFETFYMEINESLQEAITHAAREMERKAAKRPIEAFKARIRAAPRLIRLIRWLRGVDSAA